MIFLFQKQHLDLWKTFPSFFLLFRLPTTCEEKRKREQGDVTMLCSHLIKFQQLRWQTNGVPHFFLRRFPSLRLILCPTTAFFLYAGTLCQALNHFGAHWVATLSQGVRDSRDSIPSKYMDLMGDSGASVRDSTLILNSVAGSRPPCHWARPKPIKVELYSKCRK